MKLASCANCGHEIVEHRLEQNLTSGACRRCACEGFTHGPSGRKATSLSGRMPVRSSFETRQSRRR